MGSSTLSHIWKCNTLRSSVPLNMHFLIGGTVVEIHRMFLKEYGSSSEPLNVIFSCAINSIPLESAQQIITQMKCFNYSVKQLNKDNSVIFSTMSFPPKLCDSHNPNYQTNIQKIKTVNNWVDGFNRSNSGLSLNLSSYGSLTVDGQVVLKYDEWKEVNVNKKLHFSSDIKRKVAVDLSKLTETLSNHSSPFPTDTTISPPPGLTGSGLGSVSPPTENHEVYSHVIIPSCVSIRKPALINRGFRNFNDWDSNQSNLYIGRDNHYVPGVIGSKWQNPFQVKKYGLEQCLILYEKRIRDDPDLMDAIPELNGKELGCWCKPSACHGDILIKLFKEHFNITDDHDSHPSLFPIESEFESNLSSMSDEYQPESLLPKVHSSPFPSDTTISQPPGNVSLFPNASDPPVPSTSIPIPEPVVKLSLGPVSPTTRTPGEVSSVSDEFQPDSLPPKVHSSTLPYKQGFRPSSKKYRYSKKYNLSKPTQHKTK